MNIRHDIPLRALPKTYYISVMQRGVNVDFFTYDDHEELLSEKLEHDIGFWKVKATE